MYRGDIVTYKTAKKKGYAVVCLRETSPLHFQGLHFNTKTNLWNTVTHKIEDFVVAEENLEDMEYFPRQGERIPPPPIIPRRAWMRPAQLDDPFGPPVAAGEADDVEEAQDEMFALDPRV